MNSSLFLIPKGTRFKSFKGFSLVELMIVVAVIALLVALALPSYQQFIRKSHRGEAQQLMMNYANLQEIHRANNPLYAPSTQTGFGLPTSDRYTFFVRATAGNPPVAGNCANAAPTAAAYTVVACAKSGTDQVNDKQSGTDCQRLTLNENNLQLPANCW